jgi:hypothetical protein
LFFWSVGKQIATKTGTLYIVLTNDKLTVANSFTVYSPRPHKNYMNYQTVEFLKIMKLGITDEIYLKLINEHFFSGDGLCFRGFPFLIYISIEKKIVLSPIKRAFAHHRNPE